MPVSFSSNRYINIGIDLLSAMYLTTLTASMRTWPISERMISCNSGTDTKTHSQNQAKYNQKVYHNANGSGYRTGYDGAQKFLSG